MSGAGNDFILINTASARFVPKPSDLAIALCPRRTSVGADGLVFVGASDRDDADISVRFWNPDGQEAATCGNGTRCAARFAFIEGLAPEEMSIETAGGDIAALVSGELVILRYHVEPTLTLDVEVSGPDGPRRGHHVELGVPHLVIQVEILPEGALQPSCRPLRFAPELGAEGANVHLVEVIDRHRIRIRSYERGVEEETLACGSGSMSAAIALCATGQIDSPVQAETRSGDVLRVRFQRRADDGFDRLELEGPARIIYWGELAASDLPALR
jgi:diaminopimelate epimerase